MSEVATTPEAPATDAVKPKAEKPAKPKADKPKAEKTVKPAGKVVQFLTALKDPAEGDLAPQPAKIVALIRKWNKVHHGKPMPRADLMAQMKEQSITAKQSVSRLFSFHKTPLVKGGYIKVEKLRVEA